MEKHEFMSPAWLEMARDEITAALSGEDLSGLHYTVCEEFTDPPRHLRQAGSPTIGFYVRVNDGRVEVGGHPVDADLTIVSDYSDALIVARDPEAAAADPAIMQERVATGRLKVLGDPASAPAALRDLDIHRLLASRTAA